MKFNNKKTPTPSTMKFFALQYPQIHNFGGLLKKKLTGGHLQLTTPTQKIKTIK